MNKLITSSKFKRNLEFIKVNIFIMWKRALEFKVNFYSSLILEILYFISIFIFFNIIISQFSNIINWTFRDLMIYNILLGIIFAFSGFITWKDSLFDILKSGNLNNYLLKPLNPSFFYTFYFLSPYALVFFLIDVVVFFIAKFYYNIHFYNIFLSIIIFILIILLNIVSYLFFLSFDLIKMGISDTLLFPFQKINLLFENYPSLFFEKFKFKIMLFIFPNFFVGTLLIPIIRNKEIWNFDIQLLTLISLIVLFFIGIKINWKIGLRKYGAYGG